MCKWECITSEIPGALLKLSVLGQRWSLKKWKRNSGIDLNLKRHLFPKSEAPIRNICWGRSIRAALVIHWSQKGHIRDRKLLEHLSLMSFCCREMSFLLQAGAVLMYFLHSCSPRLHFSWKYKNSAFSSVFNYYFDLQNNKGSETWLRTCCGLNFLNWWQNWLDFNLLEFSLWELAINPMQWTNYIKIFRNWSFFSVWAAKYFFSALVR